MKTDKRGDPPPGLGEKLKVHDPENSNNSTEDKKKKPRRRQRRNSKTRTPGTANSKTQTTATPSSASQTKQSRRQSIHDTPPLQKQKQSGSNSKRKSEKKKKIVYKEHWSGEAVDTGLQGGKIFRAVFRCSAADRTQGFVTLPGLPRDAFISGWKAQNRAIEGDVVAVRLLPTTDWHLHSTTSPAKDRPKMNDALSDAIMTPSMRPSPSGGEFPVAIAALDASSTEDECETDFQEESPYSMVGFLADTLKSQVYISSSPEKKAPHLSCSPWENAGNRNEALQCLAKILSSPEFEKHKPTAEVVAILEPSYRRKQIVGVVRREESNGRLPLALIPTDSRLPKMYLRPLNGKKGNSIDEQTRKAIHQEGNNGSRTLVVAELDADWPASLRYPWAMVTGTLGMSGHIQTEIEALLAQELVKDDDKFTGDVLGCLPEVPWTASESEIKSRRDFRDECVFSIDPPTARDLDDALSIRRSHTLPNGVEVYEIGVHIADVSHFVKPNTPLDIEAACRSTSTYLMDRVVPMLPRLLCEELCSLNPGVDRFTVSIVWHMTVNGDILETWMGRSIIRSCAKLSYPMAQSIIKEHANIDSISASDVSREKEIAEAVLLLHRVASNLRRRRFSGGDDGALRLDNVRLFFTLGEDGLPTDVGIYRQLEAHRLVEEFMLAANMTAAKRISDAFPHLALLRCHPPPNNEKMEELQKTISRLAPDAPSLEISSPGAIHTSLEAIRNFLGKAAGEMITLLCTKPMKNARYFCTGDEDTEASWSHYALAVPRYTHFTSPIRRYPDIIVHRLLLASLKHDGDEKSPTELAEELPSQDDVSLIASHANQRKLAAKAVQDGAIKIYLSAYLLKSPGVYEGVVMSLGGSRFFDVYVPELGVDVRCHTDALVKCDSQPADELIKAVWDAEAVRLELDLNADLMKKYSMDDAKEKQLTLTPGYLDIIKNQTLSNAGGLAPMEWPIVLRPMTPVRLVIGGAKRKLTGGPGGLCATLWVSLEC